MDNKGWTAGELLAMSSSYWQSCTLHAGVKLDLFTAIGDDNITSRETAKRTNCNERGITALLNALTAMRLLIKTKEKFSNTSTGKTLFIKESPDYIGHIVMHHHYLIEAWAGLDQAVETGAPIEKLSPPDKKERESFLMGMFNLAMAIAPELAGQLDLKANKRLLDLGGGPGTYTIYFCLANPKLEATVYDLPTTRPFAEKTISRFGLSDRINFVAGDYLKDDIGGPYDTVWLSHILHAHGPDECRMIIEKAVSAMAPGGRMFIHEFVLNATMDSPLLPAIFSLNMLINTEQGQSYSEDQLKEMLAGAGLRDIKRLPFKGPSESGIVCGML
ncbi:MAG: methyltransferase domain-containing protein [Desulfobacterales bacterium]|nr:methyltransferase domain-containing protein [Desulfobacterales bacterium]